MISKNKKYLSGKCKYGNSHVSYDYYERLHKENPIAYPCGWYKPVKCECGKGYRPIFV